MSQSKFNIRPDRNLLKREVISQSLKKTDLFANLPAKDLDLISSVCSIRKLKKNEIIFLDNDYYTGFYCVAEGIVKIFKTDKEGKEKIIHIFHGGNTFAEVPVFENIDKIYSGEAKFPANAMALMNSTKVILIPAIDFHNIIKQNNTICFNLLSSLSKRLKMLQSQLFNIKFQDVTKRLANFLLAEIENKKDIEKIYKRDAANEINLDISKIDLAAYIGATLETLSRTFKKLQDSGLIQVKGRKLTVLDYKGLKSILN